MFPAERLDPSRLINVSPFPQDRPLQQEPIDEEAYFIKFVKKFYSHSNLTRLIAAFPLIQLMADQVRNTLSLCQRSDPHFSSAVLGRAAQISDLYELFFIRMQKFKKSKDSTQLSELLNRVLKEIRRVQGGLNDAKLTPGGLNSDQFEGLANYIDMMKRLIETNRLDLLAKSPHSLRSDPPPSPADQYRIAVKACQYLYRAVNGYLGVIEPQINELLTVIPRMNLDHFNQMQRLVHTCLRRKQELKFAHKCDITVIFRSVCNEFFTEFLPFGKNIANLLCDDLMVNFGEVIQSPAVDQIALTTGSMVSEKESENYDKKYVQKNKDIYENYIPRVAELRDWMIAKCKKLNKSCFLIQHFLLYLELGDLNHLRKRLDANQKARSCKSILIEEIESFAKRKATDESLQQKILIILLQAENKSFMSLYQLFIPMQRCYSHLITQMHTLLDGPIETAERFSPDLFYIKKEREEVIKVLKKQVPLQETLPSVDDATKPEPQKPPVEVIPPSKPAQPKPYEQRLQNLKSFMGGAFEHLISSCKGFGSKEALENGQVHWESLLCSLKRLFDKKKELTDRQLFSIIIDIVRNGSLAIEQTLSALERSSNRIKNQEELKKILTHDLHQTLLNCKFQKGPLHKKFRDSIRDTNRGEILSRDLRNCVINGSDVEKLLTKARLLIAGNSPFSSEDILSHAMAYFQRTGLLCIALLKKIMDDNQNVKGDKVDQVEKEFLEFCREIRELNFTVRKGESLDSYSALTGIKESISKFRLLVESDEIQSRLDNLKNNLFLQLQNEMDSHPFLEPIENFHHMSKVILLNQMIAEEYLLIFHDVLGIAYDLKEVDHDLSSLIVSLEMNEKEFTPDEWNFLTDGKKTRFLARYPFSCAALQKGKPSPLEKSMKNAVAFSRAAIFQRGNQREQGFIPANKGLQLAEIQGLVNKDIEVLKKVLGKISEKILPKVKALTKE